MYCFIVSTPSQLPLVSVSVALVLVAESLWEEVVPPTSPVLCLAVQGLVRAWAARLSKGLSNSSYP